MIDHSFNGDPLALYSPSKPRAIRLHEALGIELQVDWKARALLAERVNTKLLELVHQLEEKLRTPTSGG